MKKDQGIVKETRSEVRDGKLYTVTVLETEKPSKYRSKRTKFKFKEVGKRGNKNSF